MDSESKRSQFGQWLMAIFRRNPCYKLINYQGAAWKVSLSADAANVVTVDLKDLSKKLQEITPATHHAKMLDDYQFLLCKEIERWTNDREYIIKLRGHRILAAAYIVRLAEILEQIKADSTNQGLKQELVKMFCYQFEYSLQNNSYQLAQHQEQEEILEMVLFQQQDKLAER